MVQVSIIIPVYNVAGYILQCLTSIQNQSLQDIEVIMIDDGSTDETVSVITKFIKTDSRFKLYFQEHTGAGAARNKGIALAAGKYVAFCDGDDFYLEPKALELLTAAADKNGVSVCGGLMQTCENGIFREEPMHRQLAVNENGIPMTFSDFQNDYNYQSFLFEREMLKRENIRFPHYLRYQDPPFLVRALIAAGTFWVIPVEFYCYRYGHQDFKEIGKKIKDTLEGIRDNLRVAVEGNYSKLYETLIEQRINRQYSASIVRNMSKEVLEVLSEIEKISLGSKHPIPITPLTTICDINHELYQANSMMKNIIFIMQNHYEMADYFRKKEIGSVAVYGLGYFGNLLTRELEKSDINIAALIDKNKTNWGTHEVLKPNERIPQSDVIVITAADYEKILDSLKDTELMKRKRIVLAQMLEEIVKKLSEGKYQ